MTWATVYGLASVLVVAATWATRAHPLALALAVAYVLSNLIAYAAPFEARPILFPIIDVFVVGIVLLLLVHDSIPRWAAIPMVALSVLACAAAVAFWLTEGGPRHLEYLYGAVVNVIFAAQLVITLAWGIADVVGQSRHSLRRPAADRPGLERSAGLASQAADTAQKTKG